MNIPSAYAAGIIAKKLAVTPRIPNCADVASKISKVKVNSESMLSPYIARRLFASFPLELIHMDVMYASKAGAFTCPPFVQYAG